MEAMRWAKLPLGGAMAAVRAGRNMQRCTLYAGRECGRGRVQGSGDVEVGGWAAEKASDGWKAPSLSEAVRSSRVDNANKARMIWITSSIPCNHDCYDLGATI